MNKAEKERIADNRLKIRSVASSLKHIDPAKVENLEAIEDCLEDAERSLTGALNTPLGPQRPA